MSATADATSADQAYFERIEVVFIRLRGAPLLLSPADWRVAKQWRQQEVPLALVLATLAEVFAERAARGSRGRINSLRYVAPAVEAAWERARELQASGHAPAAVPGPSVEERLDRLADALSDVLGGGPRWYDAIRALSGTPEAVEARLGELEAELHDELRAGLDAETANRLACEVEEALTRVAARLAPEERQRLSRQLESRALRRHFALPVLSLFSFDL
ncbi:MAG: hypothetical protein ACRD2Z_07930 [Thermoanaerobaculia bacterium]